MYVEISCTCKSLDETIVATKQIAYTNLQKMYSLMGEFIEKCKDNGKILTVSVSNVYEVSEYDTDWLDEEIKRMKNMEESK